MNNKLVNEQGSALAYVLIVTVVLGILGVSVLNLSTAETRFAVRHEQTIKAEYIAKAGIDIASAAFLKDNTIITNPVSTVNIGEGSYQVEYITVDADRVLLKSTGTVAGISKAMSMLMTSTSISNLFDGVRQTANGSLDLSALDITYPAGSQVKIVANTGNVNNIDLGGSEGDPNIVKVIDASPLPSVVVPDSTGFTVKNGITTGLIEGNHKINGTLFKGNNGSVVFETHDIEQIVIVDKVDFGGPHGEVEIRGSGFVKLYIIGDNSSIDNPVKVNLTNPGKLFIYVAEGKSIDLQAGADLEAYIYAPNATISIQSSQTTIRGALVGNILNRGNTQGALGNFEYKPLDNTINYNLPSGYSKTIYLP